MDITDLIPEFNQYTLIQKKLFLDWIELPVENDEEARNRFLDSLNNSDDSNNEDLNEIEINKKMGLLMNRIQQQERIVSLNDSDGSFPLGPREVCIISSEERCRIKCKSTRDRSQYQECFNECKRQIRCQSNAS